MTRGIQQRRPFWDPSFLQATETLRRGWGWLLTFGILTLLAGTFAIFYTGLATLTTVFFIAWLAIFGGLTQVFASFYARHWSGFLLHLAAGILAVVFGFLLLSQPTIGALTLTLVMAAYFLVSGIFRILAASSLRFEHWGWAVLNGVITLLLGIIIWAQWPVSSIWVLGLFLGIDLILAGWTLVSLALAAHQLPAPRAAA